MSFSLVYLAQRFVYRIEMFVYDWYIGGFLAIGAKTIGVLESLDRTWALCINVRNVFRPLYQDQSLIGHILGFALRLGRIIIAAALYVVVIIVGATAYVFWAGIPLYVIKKGFFH